MTDGPASGRNLLAASVSQKYDFPTKITTHAKRPATSQSRSVVIFDAIGWEIPEIVQGLLEIKDTHRPEGGPMLLGPALP